MIIGLSGFARTGKDEVAKILVEQHGFKRVAFADKLRDFVYALNPIVHQSHTGTITGETRAHTTYLQDVIDAPDIGWENYKETVWGPEIRRLLQRVGTEAGRQVLGDTIWIDAALKDYVSYENWVVSDARFLNEFVAITGIGGKIWRIERPGVGPLNEHPSEIEATTYKAFDATIHNDGSLEELADKVRSRL